MECVFRMGRQSLWQEKEMVKAEANLLTAEERVKLLASEIAIRAVFDLKLLKRRKVLIGDKIAPIEQRPKLTDCQCYREDENIKSLLDDFKNGSVLFSSSCSPCLRAQG
ncbi:MAG: hypothetical protein EBR82_56460 [Caulobacteraceae bacterium]|nr:hypothetical protein [Caulobacteraceae bacterium]